MVNKGTQGRLGATDSGIRPGCFPLGSAQSRAAARAMLEARKADAGMLNFQVVSILDGKPVNFDGLAGAIRAARMKTQGGESPASLPAIEGGQDTGREGRTDCLSERVRKARERVTRAQGPVTTL
jgi:hypothetical protein